MKKQNKSTALFLTVLLLLASIVPAFSGIMQAKAETVSTLIVHYAREDQNYTGWNLWVWPDAGEGKQIMFTDNDSFGKVAVYQSTSEVSKFGFLVRLNEWESKDIDIDRFAEVVDGKAEVWITSGVEQIQATPPEGMPLYDIAAAKAEKEEAVNAEGAILLNVHYHRYDGNYDGWNIWSWPKDQEGDSYSFTEEDDFGKIAVIPFPDANTKEAGFLIRLNDWEARDIDGDRYADLTQRKDNSMDIYLVQGDPTVYTKLEDIDLSPKFLSATFPTNKEITFTVTSPVDTSSETEASQYKVTDETGKEYPIKSIWSKEAGMVSAASVILQERLDFNHSYTLTREGYGNIPVSMSGAYSTTEFEEANTYQGDDLGAVYTKENTTFKLWAPTASAVNLNLYSDGHTESLIKTVAMAKSESGIWSAAETGDLHGTYYTYTVTVGTAANEAVDPYARTTGVNGKRAMVIDLAAINPDNWENDKKPEFINMTDAIIYELHIRDLSIDPSSGIKNAGKFLGLTETGTKNAAGLPTGLDHLKELGITHLHLLPSFDYASVDETKLDTPQFNWGYDPENYNVPEGSYSTDPYNGEVRVKEYKEMVQALHKDGIRVVMDVVYNHTAKTGDSNFNKIVPDYYYRKNGETFSNASGCGNETASERSMVRKYIVDSVVYWAKEYHVDGFRFDLMGIHDIETMNAIRAALDEVDPSILIYGEGWTSSSSPLPDYERALKINTLKLNGIAAFSDDIRDGIKGSVFDMSGRGFVNGGSGLEESIKSGVVASTDHPQIDYSKVNYSNAFWSAAPSQSINYASAHDNLSLFDKLASSNPDSSLEDRIKMNKLSAAIVLTSQGIPFFQAGEEILRSKPSDTSVGAFDENSYKSSDAVNSIKWDTKTTNQETFDYYKGLIAFRKAHSGLRMTTTEDLQKNLSFLDNLPENVVAYTISNKPNGEIAENICVIYNANPEAVSIFLPSGTWDVYIDGKTSGTQVLSTITDQTAKVEAISCLVLTKGQTDGQTPTITPPAEQATSAPTDIPVSTIPQKEKSSSLSIILIIVGVVIAAAGITVFVLKRKK